MNYKAFYKEYCPGYNWVNSGTRKIYCNPSCPFFIGLSKRKTKLVSICEYEEEKYIKTLLDR